MKLLAKTIFFLSAATAGALVTFVFVRPELPILAALFVPRVAAMGWALAEIDGGTSR